MAAPRAARKILKSHNVKPAQKPPEYRLAHVGRHRDSDRQPAAFPRHADIAHLLHLSACLFRAMVYHSLMEDYRG